MSNKNTMVIISNCGEEPIKFKSSTIIESPHPAVVRIQHMVIPPTGGSSFYIHNNDESRVELTLSPP